LGVCGFSYSWNYIGLYVCSSTHGVLIMNKLFEIKWGAGYAHPDNKIVGLDFITEDYGWHDCSIEKVEGLEVGQTADCSDIGGEVYVKRIQ